MQAQKLAVLFDVSVHPDYPLPQLIEWVGRVKGLLQLCPELLAAMAHDGLHDRLFAFEVVVQRANRDTARLCDIGHFGLLEPVLKNDGFRRSHDSCLVGNPRMIAK